MKKLIWLAIAFSLMFAVGCAKKQVAQEEVVVVEETEVVVLKKNLLKLFPRPPWKSMKVSTEICPLLT